MADEVKYYNAPIELYRHFLEHPRQCLDEVLKHDIGCRKKKGSFSGVLFSIPRSIFYDYYENEKTDRDLKCLLCYLALKSIQGKKSYGDADNEIMLRRMCGYGRKEDFDAVPKEELGRMGSVFSTDRNMQESGRRIRLATMQMFDSFHCSTHTRGLGRFFFIVGDRDRDKCMAELSAYIEDYKRKIMLKNNYAI